MCFLSYHEELCIRDAANSTVDAIQPFYLKSRIPTLATTKMAFEIEKHHKELKNLQKIKIDMRQTEGKQRKIAEFKVK